MSEFLLLNILANIGITKLLDFHYDKCEIVSVSFVIIIGVSLITGEIGDLFTCLLVSRGLSFINSQVIYFVHFSIGLLPFSS